MVTVARGVLEKGMSIPGLSCGPLVLPTFESNVLFILRFMVDCQARGELCEVPDQPSLASPARASVAGDGRQLGGAARWRVAAHEAPRVQQPGTLRGLGVTNLCRAVAYVQ